MNNYTMEYENYEIGGEVVTIPVPRSYKDCFILAQSDMYRHQGYLCSIWRMLYYCMTGRTIAFYFWFRMTCHKGFLYPITKFFLKRFQKRYGIQIYTSTKIGYGLYIGHFFGTLVHTTSVIGNNVNLFHFTSIGSNGGRGAYIGNYVHVGPSVSMVGALNVGSKSSIGVGSVVTKDVPPCATVAGVPAKVLTTEHPARFIHNPYEFDKNIF